MHRHLVPKLVGAIVLVTALGGGAAYAFTASNTVSPSYAGQGSATVSGYTVTNISYGLFAIPAVNPGDPQDAIISVSFNLSPDNATFVAVDIWGTSNPNGTGTANTLVGGGGGTINGAGSPCTETSGLVTCSVTGTGSGSDTQTDPNVAAPYPTPSDITSVDIQASS